MNTVVISFFATFGTHCLEALQNSGIYFELILPEGVEDIGTALQGLDKLTSVTIPGSVTSIGSDTFSGCTGLTSVSVPGDITNTVYSTVFNGCTHLNTIEMTGTTVTDKWKSVIKANTAIRNIVVDEGVTAIDEMAFYQCSGITSISLPESVTSIGRGAFSDCSILTSVTFSDPTGWQYADSATAADSDWIAITLSDAGTAASWLTGDGKNECLRKVPASN